MTDMNPNNKDLEDEMEEMDIDDERAERKQLIRVLTENTRMVQSLCCNLNATMAALATRWTAKEAVAGPSGSQLPKRGQQEQQEEQPQQSRQENLAESESSQEPSQLQREQGASHGHHGNHRYRSNENRVNRRYCSRRGGRNLRRNGNARRGGRGQFLYFRF